MPWIERRVERTSSALACGLPPRSAAHLHFPVNKAAQHGGKVLLKKWADVLRQLASELDAIASSQGLDEPTALFMAKGAVRKANVKVNAYKGSRQSAFR